MAFPCLLSDNLCFYTWHVSMFLFFLHCSALPRCFRVFFSHYTFPYVSSCSLPFLSFALTWVFSGTTWLSGNVLFYKINFHFFPTNPTVIAWVEHLETFCFSQRLPFLGRRTTVEGDKYQPWERKRSDGKNRLTWSPLQALPGAKLAAHPCHLWGFCYSQCAYGKLLKP